MIIRDSHSNVIKNVPVTKGAELTEQLMQADNIKLSWVDVDGSTLPVGAYVVYNGERYSLIEPYTPEQKTENSWSFEPVFHSVVFGWAKVPFFMYTKDTNNNIIPKEPDWSLTAEISQFCTRITESLQIEIGQHWSCLYDSALVGYKAISFESADVLSALSTIAQQWETEWWVDKAQREIHFGKAGHGVAVDLEVGVNIGVPSVTANKDGYFNRFYVFGSTRNITQDYRGANVNSLVNKRLTLNPAQYPGGYIDTDTSSGSIASKVLVFDEVYPKSNLKIKPGSLKSILLYRLDEQSERIQVGTDSQGQPVYDQYAVWFFKLCDRTTGADFNFVNKTFDADNPDGMLIPDKKLSAHFESGALVGQEFELIYHEDSDTLKNIDGTPITVDAGSFEIKFKEENGLIIPSILSLCPYEGDNVILFNVAMPADYIASAQAELLVEAQKEIQNTYTTDNNNYEFKSNSVAFCEHDPNLCVGRNVRYTNGSQILETRVIKIVKKLARPSEQTITIGNSVIKGNTATLKEEVATANKDINVLAEINEMTNQISQSYNRAQQSMAEGFAAIKDMWRFDPNNPDTIYTRYNVYTERCLSAFGRSEGGTGTGSGSDIVLPDLTNYFTKQEVLALIGNVETDLSGYYNRGEVDAIASARYTKTEVDSKLSSYIKHYGNVSNQPTPTTSGLYYIFQQGGSMGGDGATNGMSIVAASNGQYGFQIQGAYNSAGRVYVRGLNAGVWQPWVRLATVNDVPTSMPWTAVTGKPTTLGGYGITDAFTKSEVNSKLADYLPLTGGTLSGGLSVDDELGCGHLVAGSVISDYASLGNVDCNNIECGSINANGNVTAVGVNCDYVATQEVITDDLDVYRHMTVHAPDYEGIVIKRTKAGAYGGSVGVYKSDGTKLGDMGFNGDGYFSVRNHTEASLISAWCHNGYVGIGTASPQFKLDVAGTMRVAEKRIYFGDASHYIELDSDGHFHFSHGVYSNGFVSAFGKATGSGGGTVSVDLSDYYNKGESNARYYTKQEVNDILSGYAVSANYVTASTLNDILSGYSTTVEVDSKLSSYIKHYGNVSNQATPTDRSGFYYIFQQGGSMGGDGYTNGASIVARGSSPHGFQLQGSYSSGRLYSRGLDNGVWKDWHELAFTSDIPTTMPWTAVTGKPTTLSGYGITDAYTRSEVNSALSGYLPLTGGRLSGELIVNDSLESQSLITGLITSGNVDCLDIDCIDIECRSINCSGVEVDGNVECDELDTTDIHCSYIAAETMQIDDIDVYNRLTINTGAYEGGLTLNRTVDNSGAAILVRCKGTRLGSFGIQGGGIFDVSLGGTYQVIHALADGKVGIGKYPTERLDVAGIVKADAYKVTNKRIYFGSDLSTYIEVDSSGCFHFSHGVYSDGFVSAYGKATAAPGTGGTNVDLDNYYTKNEINLNHYTKQEVNDMLTERLTASALVGYVTEEMLNGALGDYVTTTSLTKALKLYATSSWVTNRLQNYATKAHVQQTLGEYASLEYVDERVYDLNEMVSALDDAVDQRPTLEFITHYIGDCLYNYLPRTGGTVTGHLRTSSLSSDNYLTAVTCVTAGSYMTTGTYLNVGTDLTVGGKADIGSYMSLYGTTLMVCEDGASVDKKSLDVKTKQTRRVGMLWQTVECYADVRAGSVTVDNLLSEGYVTAYGTASASDSRLKCDLEDVSLDVSAIASAPLVTHGWVGRKDLPRSVGTIAQYWRSVLPEAVSEGEWLSLDYGKLATACAISMAREIERLRTELNEIKQRI